MDSTPSSHLVAPPLGHESRGVFEDAVRSLNIADEEHSKLDYFIENAINSSFLFGPDLKGKIKTHQDAISEMLKNAEKSPFVNMASLYHLATKIAFIEQMILVPRVFSDPEPDRQDREKLTDCVLGLNSSLIESELKLFNDSNYSQEKSYLTGLINEQTAMGIINTTHDPNIIALPSTLHEDMRGIDFWVHTFDEVTGTYEKKPYQVKTSPDRARISMGITTIAMQPFNEDFTLSKAIVNFMETGNIDEKKLEAILRIRRALLNKEDLGF